MITDRLVGRKAVVTTDAWFFAPDGESYRAVFGTLRAVHSDHETLGIKTNARSTNWYLEIGNVLLAGCQIHYLVLSDTCSFDPPTWEGEHEGKSMRSEAPRTRIYNADEARP